MVSVENFYWILYHNLLKPVRLDAWYYFPFGTTERLCQYEFGPRPTRHHHHALFQFDQEPIWSIDSIYQHCELPEPWTNKTLKILANSEQSAIKKKMCLHHNMLDWYFFYHGFAALDWFADCQYIDRASVDIVKPYLSFNHIVTSRRAYRMALTARLDALGVLDDGIVSFHGTKRDCIREISSDSSYLSDVDRDLIARMIAKHKVLSRELSDERANGAWSAQCGHSEYNLWQQAFVHLVNETVFYDDKLHLTEKIFKPIVAERPFILACAPGNLAYLKSYGFKTFDPWIDEDYDRVLDPTVRLAMITEQVAKFCNMPLHQLRQIHQEMKPILEYNKRHFFQEFRQTIVHELVDNFESCIKIWNNGRVDERSVPYHRRLDEVKARFLS